MPEQPRITPDGDRFTDIDDQVFHAVLKIGRQLVQPEPLVTNRGLRVINAGCEQQVGHHLTGTVGDGQ